MSQAPIAWLVSGVSAQDQKVEVVAGDRNKIMPVTNIIVPWVASTGRIQVGSVAFRFGVKP